MRRTGTTLLAATALLAAPLLAQGSGSHLVVDGDAGAVLPLAPGWRPEPIVRDEEGRILKAPFWSSWWEEEGELAPGAELPPRPDRLLKQRPDDVILWGVSEYKLHPVVITTAHAKLVLDLDSLPARKVRDEEIEWLEAQFPGKVKSRLTPPQVAHLYGLRYLRMEAMWRDVMCLEPGKPHFRDASLSGHFGSAGRSETYVFSKKEPYQEFGRHFFGVAGDTASWWWHKETETVIGALHGEGIDDPVLAARFDAILAHNLVCQYRGWYHFLPVWIPTGVGHYFERRHPDHEDTFILLGLPSNALKTEWAWNKPDWWRETKTLVRSGEALGTTELGIQTDYEKLTPRFRAQAWSMVDYMLGIGKDRWRTFLDEMKVKGEYESLLEVQQRAFIRAYGVNMVEFENRWKDWVRKTKPPRRRR